MNPISADPITLVYHELRSPLGLVATAASSLVEVCWDDASRARCEAILRAAERMLRTADEVIALSRPTEERRHSLTLSPIELVRLIVADYQALGAPVVLEDTGACLPVPAAAPERLEALVCSLLTNARDHGASDVPVVVGVNAFEGHWTLTVRNRLNGEKRHHGLRVGTHICLRLASSIGATLSCSTEDGDFVALLSVPLEPSIRPEPS